MTRGLQAERIYSRCLPHRQWGFEWHRYVLVGEPDGLGADLAYEFKNTSRSYLVRFRKPVADAQVALYARFFAKARTLVEIRVEESDEMIRDERSANLELAERTLLKFEQVDAGLMVRPPAAWKCKEGNCDERERCQIRQGSATNPPVTEANEV